MRNLLLALCLVIGIAQVSFAQGNEKSTAKTTSTSVQPSVSVDKAGTTSHPACTEKKMAEDLTEYLDENGIKVRYMHSDIDTLERIEIIRDLRLGIS